MAGTTRNIGQRRQVGSGSGKDSKSFLDTLKDAFSSAAFSDKSNVRKHRPDVQIVLYMGLLMLLGLIVMYAIGPQRANVLNNAYGSSYSDTYFVWKQLMSVGMAVGVFIIISKLPYTFLTRIAPFLYAGAVALCLLLFVADIMNLSIAKESLGATRWFDFGIIGFQPAEFAKFAMLVFTAGFIGLRMKQGLVNDYKKTLIPLGVFSSILLFFIIIIQKDLGTGLALASIVLSMLVVAGLSMKRFIVVAGIVLSVIVLLIVSAPHRVDRMLTFFKGDSTSTSDAGSYHIQHAKIAIGTGGLFGVGVGNSVQATGYLPEAINDSVFAIMGETFGFVGLIAILAIFIALLLRLLRLSDHLVDERLKLIAAGMFGWFGAHVILNIAAMIGVFPLTGITLPLLSFGGTSMLFIAAGLGLVFQLSSYTSHNTAVSQNKEANNAHTSSRRGVGRPRHTSRRSHPGN